MSLARVCLSVVASMPWLPAQQQWVSLQAAGTTGVGVAESPLPPTILAPFPFGASSAQTFVGSAFRRRADVLPLELAGAQAAVFDAARQRIVAYSTHGGASTVCVFDGARWSVLPTTNVPPPRVLPALAFDVVSGKVVLFGGGVNSSFGAPLGDTWLLDGDAWTQVGAPGPLPRRSARLSPAVIPGGFGLLLFGGNGMFGAGPMHFDDTWAFDGTSWTQLFPSQQPSPREGPAMAFDAGSATTVLYGGRAFVGLVLAALDDAWAWDGSDWNVLPPPAGPALGAPVLLRDGGRLVLVGGDETQNAIRAHAWQGAWTQVYRGARDVFAASITFDPVHEEVVRFGGRDGTTQPDSDTWIWGGRWQPTTPTVSPPGRERAAFAWHGPSGRAVLFGGQAPGVFFGDTWLWDGLDWQQAAPAAAPGPRGQVAGAFAPTRGTVVVFGGVDGTTWFDDTWEWNGVTWSPVASAVAPPARPGSMAFDEARQVLALFVGSGTNQQPGQLWEMQAAGWTLVSTSAPNAGDLVYDPVVAGLSVFATIGQSADYVAGVWVPRNQNRIGPVVGDPTRGVVLAIDQDVHASVPVPAATSVYGAGCGPVGEVTCSLDHRPAFGAPTRAIVRAWGPGTPTFLFFGASQANVPFGGGCTVHIDNLLLDLAVFAAPTGWAAIDFVIPTLPGTLGVDVFAQALTLQPAGFGFSNGVALRLGM
jgi:hypothetical protein